jgi:membrane protease YdiL (CAAX protease family)
MRGPDSAADRFDSTHRGKLIRFICLVLVVAVLFASSFHSLRTETAQTNQDVAKLMVDTLFRTRSLYSTRPVPGTPPHPVYQARMNSLSRHLNRLADISPNPRTIRRLAITEYALGDSAWRSSLLRLRTIPITGPTFNTERELAMWRAILDSHVASSEVPDYEKRLSDLDLGWYHHLALEALYQNAGMAVEARNQEDAANGSTSRMLNTLTIGTVVGFVGLFFAITQVASATRKKRSPWDEFQLTPVTAQTGLPPINREQADALYSAFIIYLASFALIRLVMTQVVYRFAHDMLSSLPPEGAVGLQLALGVAAVVPALAWLWWKSKSNGMRISRLGLKSTKLGQDILWGIGGYVVALPLVYIATIISNLLFGGMQSPSHPVLAELAVTHGAFYLVLMFTQIAILPPLVEELMFRGIFFRSLSSRMTIPAAVILSSTLFALLHPQLPLGFLGIFILGIIFNLLYIKRGSLLPGMIAHALNNGVIFLFYLMLISE